MLAKHLDSKGFKVIACCLFPNNNGAKELEKSCSERLKVVGLDVTKDESVAQVKEFVLKNLGDSELWAIVNNAGILKGVTIELTSLRDFKDSLEVNALGLVRVTQAFLPLLRRSKGRVVNITSAAGRNLIIFMGSYYMSKHAAVAFNDCLRREMEVWGIRVISIEPDFFGTPLIDEDAVNKGVDETFSTLSDDVISDYGERYLQGFKETNKYFFMFANSIPKEVIDALDSAITLKYPDNVYEPRASLLTTIIGFIYCRISLEMQDFVVRFFRIILRFPKPKTS
ncbi:17-beta-hydroxysteroid dehydrogenase type 6 like protein [Argiope bruennichi]|uniref:17-beta-hydroxysteroid dehydrogenase type 6 like protein n=2 Tax=Argiope bruennichi TaxID=94029 RepID=A0A8T0E5C1_ARGBR|nr:17-beta-hydroxysteroid dehydrogenase type 6 like protein [Argiope bruennichi]